VRHEMTGLQLWRLDIGHLRGSNLCGWTFSVKRMTSCHLPERWYKIWKGLRTGSRVTLRVVCLPRPMWETSPTLIASAAAPVDPSSPLPASA